MPVKLPPLTVPPVMDVDDLAAVQMFWPTSKPTNWLLPVALTVKLVSVEIADHAGVEAERRRSG